MPPRVTSSDVAAAAGVSRSTVSFVLNETPGQTISAAVRQRVREQAVRLGYRPDPHARALVRGSSHIVLVILPRWPVEYALRQILDEASTALDQAGYTLVTSNPHHSGNARPLWETLRPDIVLPLDTFAPGERDSIANLGIRVIDFDASRPDLAGAAQLQISHLVDRGHRSIAFASSSIDAFSSMNAARRDVASEACRSRGVSVVHSSVDAKNAAAVVTEWVDSGVTGVAAFNDDVAALVLGGALRSGFRVPEQLAVVGHDDTPIAQLLFPTLTSIRFDITGLGWHLATMAIAAAHGRELPHDPPSTLAEVIVRESS